MSIKNIRRNIRCLIDTAEIRTATFNEQEHFVLPVVALVGDVVVNPMNSTGPEFVPSDVLAHAPGGWAGRPVVPTHPDNGTASANEPRTLEKQQFGILFNPRFEDGKLKVDAWIEADKAESVGGDAVRVLETARAAMNGEEVEPIEVSIGAWVSMEERAGVAPSGDPFSFRWAAIVPDHLAVGLDGSPGACSVDMGCGTPRLNQEADRGRALLRVAEEGAKMKDKQRNILSWLKSVFRSEQEDGVSDSQLRQELFTELNNVEPGFEFIEDVFQESGKVVYGVWRDDALMLFRRSFEVDDAGQVTLADDTEQVEAIVEFQAVTAEGEEKEDQPDTVMRAGCGCSENQPKAAQANKEGEAIMEKLETLVDGLIACEATPFTDEDRETLSAFGEEKLTAMSEQFAPVVEPTPTEAAPTDATPEADADAEGEKKEEDDDDESITLSKEEYDDIITAAAAHKVHVANQRTALITELSSLQSEYTAEELEAMSLESLERTRNLLAAVEPGKPKVSSYVGQGMPTSPEANEVKPAPKPYSIALEKRKTA